MKKITSNLLETGEDDERHSKSDHGQKVANHVHRPYPAVHLREVHFVCYQMMINACIDCGKKVLLYICIFFRTLYITPGYS